MAEVEYKPGVGGICNRLGSFLLNFTSLDIKRRRARSAWWWSGEKYSIIIISSYYPRFQASHFWLTIPSPRPRICRPGGRLVVWWKTSTLSICLREIQFAIMRWRTEFSPSRLVYSFSSAYSGSSLNSLQFMCLKWALVNKGRRGVKDSLPSINYSLSLHRRRILIFLPSSLE